jgi:hypothetical protein
MTHVAGHNVENDGAIYAWNPDSRGRQDAGPAGRGELNQRQYNWQDAYYNPTLRSQGLANDNRTIGTRTTPTWNMSFTDQLAGLFGNSGSGSGSSGDSLARAQFEYQKRQDALDRKSALEALNYGRDRDARVTSGLQNYYGGGQGQFNSGFDNLLKMITDQGKVSSDAVGKSYDRAMTGIGQGYDAAQSLGDTGFNALNTYLQANPNNPYAGMTAQVGSAPDALTDYLSAYGVSDAPVQGQIQADQLQAQQGAGNFQNLIDVLGGVAQQGAGSRGAESQMAQLLFNTGLGQDRAGYTSQAENAQAQALAALQQAMFQSRFGVEGDRNNLSNQLAMSVIQAGGDIDNNNKKKKENDDGSGPLPGQLAETATPQEIVANQLANLIGPSASTSNTVQQLLEELNARRGR